MGVVPRIDELVGIVEKGNITGSVAYHSLVPHIGEHLLGTYTNRKPNQLVCLNRQMGIPEDAVGYLIFAFPGASGNRIGKLSVRFPFANRISAETSSEMQKSDTSSSTGQQEIGYGDSSG